MTTLLMLLQINDETLVNSLETIQKTSSKLIFRLLIDLISIFILVRLVYFKANKKSDLNFTFYMFNIVIFFICFLLNKVELSLGAAFGLFAVFGMLRYRTEDISIKDMTYLFLVIAIGLITSVTKIKNTDDGIEYLFMTAINAVILIIAFVLESNLFSKKEQVKLIVYEKISLINSQNQTELLADIMERTGLKVHRLNITKIDFMNDSALIKIYYYEDNS
ncbi:MAG: DUF4956 domain-containing protein [Bacteroidota bacterium]|nr:DUF4956 domain-containing protein [Bacteroidota bacterium]